MSVYSIPVTLGIDEEAIEKKISSDIERHVLSEISKKIQKNLFDENYYSKESWVETVARAEILKMLTVKEEEIIDKAAEKLADKLSRSKAVREIASNVAKEIFG